MSRKEPIRSSSRRVATPLPRRGHGPFSAHPNSRSEKRILHPLMPAKRVIRLTCYWIVTAAVSHCPASPHCLPDAR